MEHYAQVSIDLISTVPGSYDQRLVTWTPMWHFVWICMYVLSFSFRLFIFSSHNIICSFKIFAPGSTFSDTYGFFNLLMPGTSFYSAIESSSLLVSFSMERDCDDRRTLVFLFLLDCLGMLPFYLSLDELSCLVLAKLSGVENICNCFTGLLSN